MADKLSNSEILRKMREANAPAGKVTFRIPPKVAPKANGTMAYIKDLAEKCSTCSRAATKEVIDRWNGSCGKFCSSCAKTKLKQVTAYEKNPKA